MKRFLSLVGVLSVSMAFVGCGDGGETVPFEKSELEKYVEDNPVPLVSDEDFSSADEEISE
ncbi:hypothetical protein [Aporhodopirellula aestuarii]|uniref:Secreted protein n=1 Tax=Aporhodopirellula aestuarii TaxID=2950107 RepID=A0ABT0UD16_9BACT|nr:hypothetical protein [Aporhodopirellula aestuarii]MCM2374186.1 hypothetical protein [Aporhodopirellula aestuarii]